MRNGMSDSAPLYALIILVGIIAAILSIAFGIGRFAGAW